MKRLINLEVEDLSLPFSDFRPYICKYIQSQWQLFWDTQAGNKLHEINPKIDLWKSSLQLYCKDQVLLIMWRIGHSHLTHSLLLNKEPVPECMFCACPLTIHHVLLECADLILLRQQYFNDVSMSDLFLDFDGETILASLKASGQARLPWLFRIFWFFILWSWSILVLVFVTGLVPFVFSFRILGRSQSSSFTLMDLMA